MKIATAATAKLDTAPAALELRQELEQQLGPAVAPDLILFFAATRAHARSMGAVLETFQETWEETAVLGTTGSSLLHARASEHFRPTITAIAAVLPGAGIVPFRMKLEDFEQSPVGVERWEGLFEAIPDPSVVILLADPFTTPTAELLETLNRVAPGVPAVGALASGARRPGGHVLALNHALHRSGVVGVAIAGDLRADVVISQGYRPVGQVFRVTRAEGNQLLELNGAPALEALERMVASLPHEEQVLLKRGLMLGEAIDGPSAGLGRGDFLIRPVVGLDHEEGAIALAGLVDEGQSIRFQVWDNTLDQDLEMLLLPQLADTHASGGLIFGSWPHRRTSADEALSAGGVERALGYSLPLTGFRSAGEIGPARGLNYLHTHTATLALLRPAKVHSEPRHHPVE
jgi:small ligand-binding sensory domain FIST